MLLIKSRVTRQTLNTFHILNSLFHRYTVYELSEFPMS